MKLVSKLFVLAFAMATILPSTVFAMEGSQTQKKEVERQKLETQKVESQTEVKKLAEAKKCEQLDKITGKLSANFDQKKAAATEKRADKRDLSKDRRDERTQDLTQKRAEWDAKREQSFEALRAKATTDEQKAAVEAYIVAIKDAVSKRRAAHDSAQAAFRSGLDAALAARRSQEAASSATLKSQIDSAIARAKASCQSGTSFDQVKATLKADIKAAQETFKNSRKSDLKSQIEALVKTRKATFDAANQAFKDSSSTAKTDLKKAFGEQASTIEN